MKKIMKFTKIIMHPKSKIYLEIIRQGILNARQETFANKVCISEITNELDHIHNIPDILTGNKQAERYYKEIEILDYKKRNKFKLYKFNFKELWRQLK